MASTCAEGRSKDFPTAGNQIGYGGLYGTVLKVLIGTAVAQVITGACVSE